MLVRRAAKILWYFTIACLVASCLTLLVRVTVLLPGLLFALADATGSPTGLGIGLALEAIALSVWASNAPLLELVGLLVLSLIFTRFLYKREHHAVASAVAVVLLVAVIPLAKAEIYFINSAATLPLDASGVEISTYHTLQIDPHQQAEYAVDRHHVYCGNRRLPGADPKTFALVPDQGKFDSYARDATNVWFRCKKLPDADAASFVVMPESGMPSHAKDSGHVYFQDKIIAGADPTSYVQLTFIYAKDDRHVWGGLYVIDGADPSSFEVLNDNSRCYGADCPPDARDNEHRYLHGQLIRQIH